MFVADYTFQKFDFIASASENFHNLKHIEAYFCHFSNFYIKPHFLKNTHWKMFWHERKRSDQLIFNSQIYIQKLFQLTLLLLSYKKVVSWLPPPVLYTVALYSDEERRFMYRIDQSGLTIFCIIFVWLGGPRSPVRIIAQVQWFVHQKPTRAIWQY